MTEPAGEDREGSDVAGELVVHKATRECLMIEPHPRGMCGIVTAREQNRDRADAARRQAGNS
jgi:hypothetical protein